MGVENVQMMWLKSPQHCYKTLNKKIRGLINTKGAGALAGELSDLCDEYWAIYCDVHDRKEKVQSSIQAWYLLQAVRKVLVDYGWWHKSKHIPIDWMREGQNDTTGNTRSD